MNKIIKDELGTSGQSTIRPDGLCKSKDAELFEAYLYGETRGAYLESQKNPQDNWLAWGVSGFALGIIVTLLVTFAILSSRGLI